MAEPQAGAVPFQEAIDYLHGKLNIPTERWDDLQGEINAKAFTVAGATKADLLADIHQAINDAAANGTTITDFRKQFDEAVAKYGWSYKGSRGWRTRVIYDNNLGSAFAAGKWQQIQRTQDSRPYLEYVTAGDARVRPEHAAWEGKVLPIDDPWWNTHYPPNGWNCRCTVRTLSQDQMESEGLTVSQAPPLDLTERINPSTGEVYGKVPKGIDVGFDFNVGKAWLGPDIAFGEKIMAMPEAMRSAALDNVAALTPYLSSNFSPWANQLLDRKQPLGEIKTVGYLSNQVVDSLASRNESPTTAVITITDKDVMHMLRDAKDGKHIPADVIRALPDSIANPDAVLWDKTAPGLLYVFSVPGFNRQAKLVVKINYKTKARAADGARHSVETNMVRTGGLVPLTSLLDKTTYEVLQGSLGH